MHIFRLRARVSDTWDAIASVVLVVAGILAGLTPLVGWNEWASWAALLITVLSGARILRAELVVPARKKTLDRATRLCYGLEGEAWRGGTAVQVSAGVWITAATVATEQGTEVRLFDRGNVPARTAYSSQEANIAILHTPSVWSPHVKATWREPEAGEAVVAVGWTLTQALTPRQLTLEYVVEEIRLPLGIPLAGPLPPPGFIGAPVFDPRRGRVIGLLTDGAASEDERLTGALLTPLSSLPAHARRACSGSEPVEQ
ncbi:trypsin-like peptidase domain-containing protein [Streptomyces sp. BA2]|uniref:trypsin-like peptidase domain-containing protein n=1 Tax=Streptomyces sp. BA2 TaxID=436595 RepID=UPI00136E5EA8|nr:trypsin-like peptidase domain-containing protein [Streptomyces sp. BA2]